MPAADYALKTMKWKRAAMIAEAFPKARLTLFDVTPEMLMIARQRLKPLGKRVRFVTADFASAAPSKRYDAVVSALAIHPLSRPQMDTSVAQQKA